MLFRMRVVILFVLAFSSLAIAGDKKKILLPAYVLQARTVLVLIDPSAGTSTTAPMANKTAQEDVEKALIKWGRFTPVLDTQTADFGDNGSQGLRQNGAAHDRRPAYQ